MGVGLSRLAHRVRRETGMPSRLKRSVFHKDKDVLRSAEHPCPYE
jgi:hypothetical protein